MPEQQLDIIDKLDDLAVQATKERSHYYVASCAREASAEIRKLRQVLYAIRNMSGNL